MSAAPEPATGRATATPVDRAAPLLALAIAAFAIARLAQWTAHAVPGADECFHATVAQYVASHHALPRELPQFYGGFAYFYPPLFHALGAAWIRAFGATTLFELNVVLYALTVTAAAWAARDRRAPAAGTLAAALLLASGPLAAYATRFYAETLQVLLAVLALGALLRLLAGGRARWGLALGVATGAMLLTKHSALAVLGMLPLLALLAHARHERTTRNAFLLATTVALALAAPFWWRNAHLFGAPFYPAGAHDGDPYMLQLLLTDPAFKLRLFAVALAAAAGPAIALAALVTLAGAVHQRRVTTPAGVLATAAALAALATLEPLAAPRHAYPLVACAAVAAALGVARAFAVHPRARAVATLAALAIAAVAVATRTDPRPHFDARPDVVEAAHAVARLVPPDAPVLSLWTYDTAWHSGRPATWPIAWAQADRPLAMFRTGDRDSVAAAFHAHRIEYALVPARAPVAAEFDGANHPAPMMRALAGLVAIRRAEIAWRSDDWLLLHIDR